MCRPLAANTIRKVHTILSGACERAVRWRWLGINSTEAAGAYTVEPAAAHRRAGGPDRD